MKRALLLSAGIAGGLVALVLVALAVLLLVIDPNDYKAEIAALVKKKTDTDLVISDRLEWSLWPSIGLRLGKLTLTDPVAKETLVAVDKAGVSVRLLPLLSKRIDIDAVDLDGGRLRFVQHADGSTSWDRLLAKLKSSPDEKSEKVAFNVKRLHVGNSSFLLKDEATGIERTVESVEVAAQDIGDGKEFPLHLGFVFRQQQADSTALLATTGLDARIRLDQEKEIYDIKALVLKTALSGAMFPAQTDVSVKADVHADMKAKQVKVAGLDVAVNYPAKGLKSPATLALAGDVLADLGKSQLNVSGLKLNAAWPDANRPQAVTARLDAALALNWLEGAVELPQLALTATVPDASWPKPLTVSFTAPFKGNWKQGVFSLSQFVLDAAGVRTQGAVDAKLPALAGTDPGAPLTKGMVINGSLSTSAFNPRAVMAALGMTPPQTSDAGVLKSASFSAGIQGDEKKILLKDIRLKLDDSTLTGEAGISDLASLRQYARLTLDHMDADRYLPPAAPATAKAVTPAPAGGAVLPVALLKKQNLDVALTAGSFKIMAYPVTAFRLAATAGNGIVTVSDLKGNIYNGGFSVPVSINVQAAEPVLRLQPKLEHMEIGPLAKRLLKKDLLEGKASYSGDLTVRGNSVDAWMKTVSGSSNLKFDNGLLHGVNAMRELTGALGKYQGLLALTGKDAETLASSQNDTEIASFAADNALENGVLNTRSLNADLKKAKVAGTGTFNLVSQQLDYRFSLNLDKSVAGERNAAYALPVRCKGSLAGGLASLCALDSGAVRDLMLKSAASKGLEKLGLKDSGKGATADLKQKADEEKQKAKDKLNEKLNEGLNRLFKR